MFYADIKDPVKLKKEQNLEPLNFNIYKNSSSVETFIKLKHKQ